MVQAGTAWLQGALLGKRNRRKVVGAGGDRTWQKKSCVWVKGGGRSPVMGVNGPWCALGLELRPDSSSQCSPEPAFLPPTAHHRPWVLRYCH